MIMWMWILMWMPCVVSVGTIQVGTDSLSPQSLQGSEGTGSNFPEVSTTDRTSLGVTDAVTTGGNT